MRFHPVFFAVLILLAAQGVQAGSGVALGGGVNLASKQYWRGTVYSHAPVVQPELSFNAGRFSLTLWGSRAIDFNYAEINIIPSYTLGDFSLVLYDYYNPVNDAYNHYFDFGDSTNRHSTELLVEYHPDHIPLRLAAATFFYNDKNPINKKAYYSTWFEAAVPFRFRCLNAELSMGLTPFEGYYASSFALLHARAKVSKAFALQNGCTLPLNLSINTNPHQRTVTFLLNVGLFYN
ncbi:hypothetical protein [Roseimarinus sediminis]|uniref:hypothetical protein n=1 Tax=Roseimarinus sediminis TaxID=1610899 RepID=UPI003D23CBE0